MVIEHEEAGEKGAFFIVKDGQRAGEMTYTREAPDRITIRHTNVTEALRGTGAGKRLVHEGVRWARETGVKVVARCPFARSLFEKDASLRDVLAG